MDIFQEWLRKLNQQLRGKQRKILLFIDNSETHSDLELSNIKIKFLPANTTSIIQPLDQGIIKNFKANYRKHLVRHLIAKLSSEAQFSSESIDISVLDAIYWIERSWNEVSVKCIKNCFSKAGFNIYSAHDNVADEISSLEEILIPIDELRMVGNDISSQEYCFFDDEIKVHETNENGEDFIDIIFKEYEEDQGITMIEKEKDSEEEEEGMIEEEYCPTYLDVLQMIKFMNTFATTQESELLPKIKALENKFNEIQVRKIRQKKQATLDKFFFVK